MFALGATQTWDDAERRAALGELTVGNYRVEERIGSGGSSSVYAARHVIIGNRVAIKILLPEVAAIRGMAERFIDEARLSSQLSSPYLPRYFDIGRLDSGEPFVVMELLDGETVAERLARLGPLAVDDTLTIARQVAEVLALAHEAGVVHRDVKPENLFWLRSSVAPLIKVLDFGIAKRLVGEPVTATQVGTFLGSPAYCAPEQLMGQVVGPAADAYALGVSLFLMLTGRLPFSGDMAAILAAKLSGPPPRVRRLRPDAPAELDQLIAQLMQPAAEDRPSSMAAVLARLELAPRLAEPLAPAPTPVRSPAPGWLLLALVIIGVGLTSLAWLRSEDVPLGPFRFPSVPRPAARQVELPPPRPLARPIATTPPAPPPPAPRRRRAAAPPPAAARSDGPVIVDPFEDAP